MGLVGSNWLTISSAGFQLETHISKSAIYLKRGVLSLNMRFFILSHEETMKKKMLWPFIMKHKEEPRQHEKAAWGRWIFPDPLTHGSNPDHTLTTVITHTNTHTQTCDHKQRNKEKYSTKRKWKKWLYIRTQTIKTQKTFLTKKKAHIIHSNKSMIMAAVVSFIL